MNHVLGIVDCQHGVLFHTGHFIQPHAAVDPIETVRLTGRTRMGNRHLVDPGILGAKIIHTRVCLRIIRINADEDIVLLIEHHPRGVFGHFVDDAALLPGGDKQRDPLFRRQLHVPERNRRFFPVLEEITEEQRIKEKIVQAAEQETDRRDVSQHQIELLDDLHHHLTPTDRPARKSSYRPSAPPRVPRSSRPR